MGEFLKIFNIDKVNFEADIISSVNEIIPILDERLLLLKGATNLIVDQNGSIFIINNGMNQLASAGSGDVLSGLIASMIGQGMSLKDALIYSVYLHAESIIENFRFRRSKILSAGDIIRILPKIITKHVGLS